MTERPTYYLLRGKEPVPCADVREWAANFEAAQAAARRARSHTGGLGIEPVLDGAGWARVAHDVLGGGVSVSTVFLGVDHNFSDQGPPLLFETMVFGGTAADRQERYSTWAEAEAGHRAIVAKLVS